MTNDLLTKLLAAAEAHGRESEPDHEAGDLRDILTSCWKRLTPAQRHEVYAEQEDVVTEWLPDA